jgi:hypothetical protein
MPMLFAPIDLSSLNEAGVREEILAPLLRALGYRSGSANNIIRELLIPYPRIQMGRRKPGKDPKLEGKADYICEVNGKYRWVVEAKASNVPITIEEVEQAFTYAFHPAIRAIYFCLCNGHEFHIYQTHLGPEAAPIFTTTYERLNDDFQAIENTLAPESIKRDWKSQTVDIGKPIGIGLRSLVKITGGYIEYQTNSMNNHVLNGLLNTITGGSIYRNEEGKLACYIVTLSSHAIFQKFNERFDLHRMSLASNDSQLSVDADQPTVFTSIRDAVIPRGERTLDIATGNSVVIPFDIPMQVITTGTGILAGEKFSGRFHATFDVQQPRRTMEVEGHFEANLS